METKQELQHIQYKEISGMSRTQLLEYMHEYSYPYTDGYGYSGKRECWAVNIKAHGLSPKVFDILFDEDLNGDFWEFYIDEKNDAVTQINKIFDCDKIEITILGRSGGHMCIQGNGLDFTDVRKWSMAQLRNLAYAVQILVELRASMIKELQYQADNYEISTEEYTVTETRKVLNPI